MFLSIRMSPYEITIQIHNKRKKWNGISCDKISFQHIKWGKNDSLEGANNVSYFFEMFLFNLLKTQ